MPPRRVRVIFEIPGIPQHHQASSSYSRMNHSVYENTKKETWGILLLWACFALWVMIPCYLLGYQQAPEETLKMVLGFPSWVFWGIALPWLGSNLAIIFFVCFGMWQRIPSMPMSPRRPTRHPPKGPGEIDAHGNPFTLDPGSQPTQGGASVRLDQLRCLHALCLRPSHGLQEESERAKASS